MSGDWILNLPVPWMTVVVLGAIYALTAGIYLLVTALAVQERARAFKAIHSDNRAANRIILGIFATSVGVAVVLIAAHSRPFSGQLAVSPAVLLQVMPEAEVPAP